MHSRTIHCSFTTLVCLALEVVARIWLIRISGHGGQTPDLDGDEDDGYDEVIYPVDFRSAGHIVDDEMHDIMYVCNPKLPNPY